MLLCPHQGALRLPSFVASATSARHAGAGGTRSRAISDRISWNICRGTATSATDRAFAFLDVLLAGAAVVVEAKTRSVGRARLVPMKPTRGIKLARAPLDFGHQAMHRPHGQIHWVFRWIGHLLKRPVGRPPQEMRRYYSSFSYQAGSWNKRRRVVAKVEWHPNELYPRVGFIVTNLARPAERVVAFYNHRGTAEQAKARSNGPGCRAAPSPPIPSAFSFTSSLTTWATLCARWRCRKRRSRGR